MTKFFNRFLLRISLQQKIDFSRHLSMIIKAGIPLIEGLRIIKKQSISRSMKTIVNKLVADVENGQSFADSLKNFRNIFGDFYVSIIQIGEKSGTLVDNLNYLCEELKKGSALKKKVRAAMIYPVILLITTILISTLLTFYIFPKMVSAFSNFGVNMPLPTKILIVSLGFLKNNGAFVLIGFVLAIILLNLLLKIRAVRYVFNLILLRIFILGTVIKNYNVANFTRVLGILLKSGMGIVDSFLITANATHNVVYKQKMIEAAEKVKRGKSVSEFLSAAPFLFPPILSEMLYVGETTGSLEETLFYLSDYYNEEVDSSLKNLTAAMEPLIILFMGVVVGFVALAVILPIYSLTSSVR